MVFRVPGLDSRLMKRALVLLLLPLAACLRPPANLAGKYDPVTVREAREQPRQGAAVRWGGTLVGLRPAKDQTCFEVASFPLDARARPQRSDDSPGRFIACAPGFYEPAVYAPGREVTVVGALNGTISGKVGQYDYEFPRVDATAVHLWPERTAEDARPGWWPSVGISVGGVF
jgi:outer membrane lipoprotein